MANMEVLLREDIENLGTQLRTALERSEPAAPTGAREWDAEPIELAAATLSEHMQSAPLSIVLVEVVKHTPAYVWMVLGALIGFGSLQMRDQMIGRARVLLLPVGLAAYSLWSAASTFGAHLEVLAAWTVGLGAMLWAAPRIS